MISPFPKPNPSNDSIPGWDPRQHTLETLLANTCVVLNDATHPLVRAYAPVPTPAMSRAQTLVRSTSSLWV